MEIRTIIQISSTSNGVFEREQQGVNFLFDQQTPHDDTNGRDLGEFQGFSAQPLDISVLSIASYIEAWFGSTRYLGSRFFEGVRLRYILEPFVQANGNPT